MISSLIFVFKQAKLFFSKKGMTEMLLWVMVLVVLILIGTLFVAQQHGLFNNNVDNLANYTGGLFGSTNN